MAVRNQFLLVGAGEGHWQEVLRSALREDGQLETIESRSLFSAPMRWHPSLYIIDSTFVDDVPSVINRIRQQDRAARILVVSLSPSWRHARAALKAGAVDYVKKSLDRGSIREAVYEAMQKMVPP